MLAGARRPPARDPRERDSARQSRGQCRARELCCKLLFFRGARPLCALQHTAGALAVSVSRVCCTLCTLSCQLSLATRGGSPPRHPIITRCAKRRTPRAQPLYFFSSRRLHLWCVTAAALRCVFAPAGCVERPARPARGHGCSNHSTSRTHRHPPMLSLIPLITPICQSGHRSPR